MGGAALVSPEGPPCIICIYICINIYIYIDIAVCPLKTSAAPTLGSRPPPHSNRACPSGRPFQGDYIIIGKNHKGSALANEQAPASLTTGSGPKTRQCLRTEEGEVRPRDHPQKLENNQEGETSNQAERSEDFRKGEEKSRGWQKGCHEPFTASQSDPDLSEQVAMEAEQEEEQKLGAAAPAEEGNKTYLEDHKKRGGKRQSHMRKKERRRGRERKRRKHKISATKLRRALMSGSGTVSQR